MAAKPRRDEPRPRPSRSSSSSKRERRLERSSLSSDRKRPYSSLRGMIHLHDVFDLFVPDCDCLVVFGTPLAAAHPAPEAFRSLVQARAAVAALLAIGAATTLRPSEASFASLGLGVRLRFGDAAQGMVDELLVVEDVLEDAERVVLLDLLGPGAQRAVGGDRVVAGLLRGRDDHRVAHGALLRLPEQLLGLGHDALHALAGLGLGLLVEQAEHPLQAGGVLVALLGAPFERLAQLPRARRRGQPGQELHQLALGVEHVAQLRAERVLEVVEHFGLRATVPRSILRRRGPARTVGRAGGASSGAAGGGAAVASPGARRAPGRPGAWRALRLRGHSSASFHGWDRSAAERRMPRGRCSCKARALAMERSCPAQSRAKGEQAVANRRGIPGRDVLFYNWPAEQWGSIAPVFHDRAWWE